MSEINDNTMPEKMRFIKEEDRAWYVDLPDYPGSHADLLMVCGADLLLEVLDERQGKQGVVEIEVDVEPFDEISASLQMTREEGGGAWYDMNSIYGHAWPVWLCKVVKYVFDGIPESIYFKFKELETV